MKKLLGWLLSIWKAIDSHKRDIAHLVCLNFINWMAAAHVPSTHWIYVTGLIIVNTLSSIGFGHAAAKGDIMRDQGNGGTP